MYYTSSKWLCLMMLFPLVCPKPSQLSGSRQVRHVVVPDLPASTSETIIPSDEPDFDDDWRLNDTLPYENLDIDEEDHDLRAALDRYTVHTHALQWFDAVAACWREGNLLATPGDATEAKQLGHLVTLLAGANITNTEMRDYMFVGIHNLGSGQKLRTVEGNAAKYISWLKGSDHGNEPSCVALLSNGRYLFQPCTRKLVFACDNKPASEGNLVTVFTPKKNSSGETFKVSVGGRVFRAHLRPQQWALAAVACAGGGGGGAGRLALPDAGRREGLLAGLLAERVFSRAEELFVDANDVVQEGTWNDGQAFSVDGNLNWVPNHPRMNRSANCAAMISSGQLVDVTCSAPRPFLCEVDTSANAALERPEYRTVAGLGRYAMHVSGRSWLSAAARCHAEGATLAVPRSKEEAAALEAMRRAVQDAHPDLPSYDLLVGAYSVLTPNKWRTLEGEILKKSEFNDWLGMNGNYLNQPYYCGGLWLGKYINLACDKHHIYICKKPL